MNANNLAPWRYADEGIIDGKDGKMVAAIEAYSKIIDRVRREQAKAMREPRRVEIDGIIIEGPES